MAEATKNRKIVSTIKDLCRACYTCVRECPAKAIRIINGQAEIIPERCIICGNCTIVCSQGAKVFLKSIDSVKNYLAGDVPVAALVAPSFPAEFTDCDDFRILIGKIKALGFNYVYEVAFGADLIAASYRELYLKNEKKYISSDCPAVVNYVRLYHPHLTGHLAPLVSPMIAMSRVVRKLHQGNIRIVFIGPCLAKKSESDEVDEKLTFIELREMLKDIKSDFFIPADFDAPLGGMGSVFPVSHGLTEASNLDSGILHGTAISAFGRIDFQNAIKEFECSISETHHLEILCCDGCIAGPGMSSIGEHYSRRVRISNYVKNKFSHFKLPLWEKQMKEFSSIDLSRTFEPDDHRILRPPEWEIRNVLISLGKLKPKDHLNCGACGYDTCEDHAIAIINGLAENEMCLPYTIEKLHDSLEDLAISNEKLLNIQQALNQTEKLAHMGQISAGIAHELNNPLGVVIMYSNILLEECQNDLSLRKDLQLLVDQASRCKNIVSGLLNFARKNQVNYFETDIQELVHRSIASVIIPENIKLTLTSDIENSVTELDQEQMIQVLSNLLKNSIESMPDGGLINIHLQDTKDEVTFRIEDSGIGIPSEEIDKIFEPFYTTKGIGKGTGLGLATTYGIVKMHKGKIEVSSNDDKKKGNTGTVFVITLPRIRERIV
jgi:iron only hydrogenase large subunit-like protein/nitrogen-specific signal transduction histidine kinase